jgi:serine/threonine-protein kinase
MNSPLEQDNWIGRSIGDRQRYRLESHLGSGGMGDVFVAMDTLLGKQVALKLIKEKLIESTALRKRFEREVALSAALKSDHIVNVSDYGVTPQGHLFYVMDYLPGQSLGQLLRQQQRVDIERTVNIITQVCEGLQLAHEGVTLWWNGATTSEHVKVVHRDLKPDNIFLVPTVLGELVKILDFGIAKIRNETVEYTNLTSMFVGTFHYAAPEQFEIEADLDERADIYSLGIILYEMLSGTDPFGLGFSTQENMISGMSWVFAHASKPLVPLRLQPGLSHLSPQLEAIVMRCLQKSPQERFASVAQLNQALQAAVTVQSKSISTTSPNFPQSFDKKTINKISAPPKPAVPHTTIPDPTINQLRHVSGASSDSTTNQSLIAAGQGDAEALSPEQQSLLNVFRELVGPIAPTLFQQVVKTAPSYKELVENLGLYLSENQRIEFGKRAKSLQKESTVPPQTQQTKFLQRKSTVPPQTRSHDSSSLNKSAIDASFIHQCERELADLIGPIANFLVQKVLQSHSQVSPTEFVNVLAEEIPDSQKAATFRQRLLK